jgi:hypothetical protein
VNNCKGLIKCAADEESEGEDFGKIEVLKVETLGGLKY